MSMWIEHVGDRCPVRPDTVVEIDLGDGAVTTGLASEWTWGPGIGPEGEGRILRYRVIGGVGIGDVNSDAPGSGARFNDGKPAMELIPLSVVADVAMGRARYDPAAVNALALLGAWQMRSDGVSALLDAAATLDHDGQAWLECAQVFDYGRRKYAAWNWIKGMPWSVPIGCAARHLLAMIGGEDTDPESGLPHRGHVMCNLVMLMWYAEHYSAGDDRFVGMK